MSERILVALDGSEHSARVVEVAADLARARHASLLLMHVIPLGSIPEGLKHWAEVEHVTRPPVQIYEHEVGARILETFCAQARKHGVENIETLIESGEPARAILAAAKRMKPSLLVIGSRGLSDLEGLAFGSVAHRVCHASPCGVVSVR